MLESFVVQAKVGEVFKLYKQMIRAVLNSNEWGPVEALDIASGKVYTVQGVRSWAFNMWS